MAGISTPKIISPSFLGDTTLFFLLWQSVHGLWEVYRTRGFVNLKNYFQNYMEVSFKPKKQKKIWNPKFISKSTTKSRFQNCTEGSLKANQKKLQPKVHLKINNYIHSMQSSRSKLYVAGRWESKRSWNIA
jgi:hypothetical protein